MLAFVDVIRPKQKLKALCFDALVIMLGSLLLALSSQVVIPLGFTPVPITLQTWAVLLLGACLGSKRGMLAAVLYLVQGMCGVPLFAQASCGWAVLTGATGGYLVGFCFAAFCVGWLLEQGLRFHFVKTLAAMSAGMVIIYAMGVLWLAHFIGVEQAIYLGVVPFLVVDAIKVVLAAILVPTVWKFLRSSSM